MKIKIIYDKYSLDEKLYTGWGVSFLIDDRILFDTGEDGEKLIHNMEYLGVHYEKIEAIVISHDHWDHTGGLRNILKKNRNVLVYVCPHVTNELKKNILKLKIF